MKKFLFLLFLLGFSFETLYSFYYYDSPITGIVLDSTKISIITLVLFLVYILFFIRDTLRDTKNVGIKRLEGQSIYYICFMSNKYDFIYILGSLLIIKIINLYMISSFDTISFILTGIYIFLFIYVFKFIIYYLFIDKKIHLNLKVNKKNNKLFFMYLIVVKILLLLILIGSIRNFVFVHNNFEENKLYYNEIEEISNYNYLNLQLKDADVDFNKMNEYMLDFYYNLNSTGDIYLFSPLFYGEPQYSEVPDCQNKCIYVMNENTFNKLSISDSYSVSNNSDPIIFVPEKSNFNEVSLPSNINVKQIITTGEYSYNNYTLNDDFISIEKTINNPLFVIPDSYNSHDSIFSNFIGGSISQSKVYTMNNDATSTINDFNKSNDLVTIKEKNIGTKYSNFSDMLLKTSYYYFVFSIILILTLLLLNSLIIQIYISLRKREFAIRVLEGNSFLSIIKGYLYIIVFSSIVTMFLSLFMRVNISLFLKLFVIISYSCFEIIYLVVIKKRISRKINTVIKGGV